MTDAAIPKITAAHLEAQLVTLKDAASTSVDPCLVAKYIALVNPSVRQVFLSKIESGYVFRGIECIGRLGAPENKYVVFEFECQPGVLCLVPPSFMVIVNIVDRFVVGIVDPYFPAVALSDGGGKCGCESGASSAPSSEALAVTLSNCVDVTISNGQACLRVPYAGNVCISVPNSVPNGTVAEACIDTCRRFGIVCGVKVSVRVLGAEVASNSWGCC